MCIPLTATKSPICPLIRFTDEDTEAQKNSDLSNLTHTLSIFQQKVASKPGVKVFWIKMPKIHYKNQFSSFSCNSVSENVEIL
jgi:hypothetical protein